MLERNLAQNRARVGVPGVPSEAVALAIGRHTLGPENASLTVRTYREGVAAKAGHDLVLEVARWDAAVEIAAEPERCTVELTADARSLEVREGLGGLKPLTDGDRDEIRRNIDAKVLHGRPIGFRSTAVRLTAGEAQLAVEGHLTIAGSTRPIAVTLGLDADGNLRGTVPIAQSAWGIKPYRGMLGALKVRDEVELAIAARLPVA
jgi:polyisoprenoid-binding protein YceI